MPITARSCSPCAHQPHKNLGVVQMPEQQSSPPCSARCCKRADTLRESLRAGIACCGNSADHGTQYRPTVIPTPPDQYRAENAAETEPGKRDEQHYKQWLACIDCHERRRCPSERQKDASFSAFPQPSNAPSIKRPTIIAIQNTLTTLPIQSTRVQRLIKIGWHPLKTRPSAPAYISWAAQSLR